MRLAGLVFLVIVFIACLGLLIGLGYGLTLLLPLSLFEAALLLLLLGAVFVFLLFELFSQSRQEARADAASSASPDVDQEARSPLVRRVVEVTSVLYPRPEQEDAAPVQGEALAHYLLTTGLWLAMNQDPRLADYEDTDLFNLCLEIARALTTLMRTRPSILETLRVSRKDLRPLLMRAELPAGALAELSVLTEYANELLVLHGPMLAQIAAHEGWHQT